MTQNAEDSENAEIPVDETDEQVGQPVDRRPCEQADQQVDSRGYGVGESLRYFLLLYPIMSLRFLYYGFRYFRQLDDYIQYFNYEHFGGPKMKLISRLGLLAARPLAGLMDLFVWSRTYSNMIGAVLVLTAMHAAAAVLLFVMFRRYFGAGFVFLAVFCLLPTGFEGTYWVSASSRILCGLFFAVVAAWFLQRFADSGRRRHCLLFAILQLVSFGFYEQAIFFSFALTVVITALNMKNLGRRAIWALLWLLNVCAYAGFTSLFKGSKLYGQRMQLVLPNTPYYFRVFLPEVRQQLKSAFLGGGFFITWRGFLRGVGIMMQDGAWIYALLVLCSAALFFVFAKGENLVAGKLAGKRGLAAFVCSTVPARLGDHGRVQTPLTALACGIVLAAAPVAPFLVLGNPWLSIRSTVMSFAGIALIVESLLAVLVSPIGQKGAALKAMAAAAAVVVFLTASVAELHDYRATTKNDVSIVQKLYSAIEDVPSDSKVVILNLNPSYLVEQSYFYHEHIHGVTESDWALTGALQAINNISPVPAVTPIASGPTVYGSFDRFDEYDLCYLFDANREFVLLRRESLGDGLFNYYDASGAMRARIKRDQSGRGILEIVETQGD